MCKWFINLLHKNGCAARLIFHFFCNCFFGFKRIEDFLDCCVYREEIENKKRNNKSNNDSGEVREKNELDLVKVGENHDYLEVEIV